MPALIEAERITTVHFVPSMLRVFLEGIQRGRCGTPAARGLQRRGLAATICWSGSSSGLRGELHNLYGPTEAAVDVTAWACRREYPQQVVPIGRPIANTRAYVLDEHRQPVPAGVPGELYIGGVQVARGYLNRPELTAETFVPDFFADQPGGAVVQHGRPGPLAPDGNLEYLGRCDHQVKIRGFRIELGEIEAVLSRHAAIREAVVVAREDSPGDKRLVAYITANDGQTLTVADLRSHVSQFLPEYMVPSAFVALERLPRTPNGKVDRKALPGPEGRPELVGGYVAPRTPLERLLAEIWCEVLGIKEIGALDDFFALGGDSIRGAILVNRLQRLLGEYVYVVALFESPTIAALADYLVRNYAAAIGRVLGKTPCPKLRRPRRSRGAGDDDFRQLRRLIDSCLPVRPGMSATARRTAARFSFFPRRDRDQPSCGSCWAATRSCLPRRSWNSSPSKRWASGVTLSPASTPSGWKGRSGP